MRDYRYLAVLTDDPDGGMNATFPDVPEAITCGDDRADALWCSAEALGLALRGYLAAGKELPDSVARGDEMVSPYADEVLKLALVETFRGSGVSVSEFSRLARLKTWEVEALVDPDRLNTIAEMENALTIIGRRLRIAVEAA